MSELELMRERAKLQQALFECVRAIKAGKQEPDGAYTQRFGPAFVRMLEKVLGDE